MKTKKSKSNYEEYCIKYDYQKDDGYWVISELEESFFVDIGDRQIKDNHDLARFEYEKILRKKYKNFRITQVIYC